MTFENGYKAHLYYDINIKTNLGSNLFDIILGKNFFQLDRGSFVEKHNHTAFEIHFVRNGIGWVKVNGKDYDIKPGSYYITGPWVYHEQRVDPANPIEKYSFKIEYKFSGLREDFFPNEENRRIAEVFKGIEFFAAENIDDKLLILNEIRNELHNQQIGYYSRIQSLFAQLFISVVRDIASKEKTDYGIPERVFYEKRNAIIEDFFERNYSSGATSRDLAQMLYISTRQLDRIMKDSFSMSFKQKMLEVRLEYSKNLLKNTGLPVKTVSEMVGYLTESNFCTLFKQKNGCTPSEYRQYHKYV